jgi:catechol 2,3-dioxygenase-like lactoylglutathione lyase family enzyme
MSTPRLHHVSVTCADLERSIAFYGGLLELPVLGRGGSDGPELSTITGLPDTRVRWAELDLGGGQVLELLEYVSPRGEPLRQRTNDAGSGHIGFAVDDIDVMHRRLSEGGAVVRSEPVALAEAGEWHGVRTMYALDPDGVTVELVEGVPAPRVVVIPEAEPERAERP